MVSPDRRSRHAPLAFVCLLIAAVLGLPMATRAQGVIGKPDNFNYANNAAPGDTVRALVVQNDGNVIVAGDFVAAGNAPRGRVARYRPDGTLDATFAAAGEGANGAVRAVVLQGDGKILIGGDFTTVDGVGRNRVARLKADGSLDPTFNPGTGANGTVHAVTLFGSNVVIGGEFTTVNGLARGRVALFNSGGTLDPSFMANVAGANGPVYALTASSSYDYYGSGIYVGGAFTTFNGSPRNRLAKVNFNSSSLDTSFNAAPGAGPNGTVYALALRASSGGSSGPSSTPLFVGGDFTAVGGTAHARLALVDGTYGSPDAAFTPSADGIVRAFSQRTASGGSSSSLELILGGDFTQVNATTLRGVAKLIGTSSQFYPYTTNWNLDLNFDPGTGATAPVLCLGAETDGKTFLGGAFLAVNGQDRPRLARLYGNGGSAPPAATSRPVVGLGTERQLIVIWSSQAYTTGTRIERSPDGVNGWTQVSADPSPAYPFIDGPGLAAATPYFYRVRAYNTNGVGDPSPVAGGTTLPAPWVLAGAVDVPFSAGATGSVRSFVYASAVQPDGRVLFGGSFSASAGTPAARNNLVRLNPDGTPDDTFNTGTGPDGQVESVAVAPDGRIVIGGYFFQVNGTPRGKLARLNADGSLDLSFAPASGANSDVESIAVQPDGRIVIAGRFTTVNGVSRNGIARLNVNGSLDPTFDPGTGLSFAVGHAVALQPDGRVVVGGFFQSVNGVTRGNLARLNADGSLDAAFAAGSGAGSWIEAVQVLPDGRIVIAGTLNSYNGVTRNGVARLNADGSLDLTFDPGAGVETGWSYAVAVQPDGKVVLGGWSTVVRGVPRLRLARLNADGTLDDTFQPGIGASSDVQTLALEPDGKIFVGGYFTQLDNTPAGYVARVLGDGGSVPPAAPGSLAATTVSDVAVALAWGNVPWESAYVVERSADGGNTWNVVGLTGPDVTSLLINNLAPGTAYNFRVRARSTNGDSAPSPVAGATTRTSYVQWKLDHGLPADAPDDGDPDGNGLGTLLEYGLGVLPGATGARPEGAVNGANLELRYVRARGDVSYAVEVSTDLRVWTTDGVDQGGPGPAVTASTPRAGGAKFLRLRVTR